MNFEIKFFCKVRIFILYWNLWKKLFKFSKVLAALVFLLSENGLFMRKKKLSFVIGLRLSYLFLATSLKKGHLDRKPMSYICRYKIFIYVDFACRYENYDYLGIRFFLLSLLNYLRNSYRYIPILTNDQNFI